MGWSVNISKISMTEMDRMDLVILDFAKVFDPVPHRRLLGKLDHYGIG